MVLFSRPWGGIAFHHFLPESGEAKGIITIIMSILSKKVFN